MLEAVIPHTVLTLNRRLVAAAHSEADTVLYRTGRGEWH